MWSRWWCLLFFFDASIDHTISSTEPIAEAEERVHGDASDLCSCDAGQCRDSHLHVDGTRLGAHGGQDVTLACSCLASDKE